MIDKKFVSLGWDVDQGVLSEWKKEVGQKVKEGDVVCIIKTRDINFSASAPADGILSIRSVQKGQTVYVGDILFYIDDRITVAEKFKGYNFEKESNTLMGFKGSTNQLSIPSMIKDVPVRYVDAGAFSRKHLRGVKFSEGLVEIGASAFELNHIEEVILQDGLQKIHSKAFERNIISKVSFPEGLLEISDNAFYFNKIHKLNLPPGLLNIGDHAFYKNQIQELQIPDSVVTIGERSFAINQIEELELSSNLKEISEGAFSENQIFEVIIPDGVIEIKKEAFMNNPIESITIPETVKKIGRDAFYSENENIKRIKIEGDETRFNGRWNSIGFPEALKPEEI